MTPTQIARRSDALYADGTCGMTRRVLCDMVAQRESDIEDAREENNKLRKELEAAKHDLQVFSANLARLGAENAKLRKELSDVYALHWNGFDCTECPWFDECDTTGGCHWLSIFIDHMRELGVEVNE